MLVRVQGGRVKVRVIEFEMEGSNQTLRERQAKPDRLHMYTHALRTRNSIHVKNDVIRLEMLSIVNR
jgi:hypothetical protein